MNNPVVFISYSHDSDAHREKVLALSERLRQDGIETRLDRYPNGTPPEGWPRWMLNQLDEAKFVLVVCTETYYRRFRGHEQPGKGKGADWEGALITQEIYDSRSNTTKFVPVFFGAAVDAHIPEPLRKDSYYALTTEDAYQNLYDFLLGQAGIEPGALGELKNRPRKQGTVLTFDVAPQAAKIDISRIIKYAPESLIGRDAEKGLLDDAWNRAVNGEASRPRVLTFVAMGGEGKTSLVAKWAAELAGRDWPGCEAAFAWSFYSQGISESASSDLFLKEALVFFGDEEMANSARHVADKGKRLAKLVGAKRTLLILDGVEPLQYAPTGPMAGQLKDYGVSSLLKALAANSQGLCVVTTRYPIPDLNAYRKSTAPEIELKRLSREAGVYLLQSLGVKGSLIKNIPVDEGKEQLNEFEKLVEDVRGHALTLNLFGGFLKRAFKGDIRQRDRVKLDKADDKIQGGHAFRAMAAYEQWLLAGGDEGRREIAILRLIGLFDRPADAGCIAALRATAIPGLTDSLSGLEEEDWEFSITGLEQSRLLTVNRHGNGAILSLDAHPLLREYFAQHLRNEMPEAFRAAHRCLYEYLCTNTHEGEQPSLDELQPLYQAVSHGCLAGMERQALIEVYFARLTRDDYYVVKKLGALAPTLGAITCFFAIPWKSVLPTLPKIAHVLILSHAGYILRSLGRVGEALDPTQIAFEIAVKYKNVIDERVIQISACANNLSELELMLGMTDEALRDAEQAVNFDDLSKVAFQRINHRATLADVLHQVGKCIEAEALFVEAEEMQAEHREVKILVSLSSSRYCDLLLAAAERAAWRALLLTFLGDGEEWDYEVPLIAVSRRAELTLEIAEHNVWLLDAALDHLTLGRVGLYQELLYGFAPIIEYTDEIEFAVDGLRSSGQRDYLPRGLLTRSWLRVRQGDLTGAQSDLDEAWEIAERGPMPLYQADILMYRARLFFREAEYPWCNEDGSPRSAKQDLAEARRLIEKHGYWRRREELEDAEAVIGK